MNDNYDFKNYTITFIGESIGSIVLNNLLKTAGFADGDGVLKISWNGENEQTVGADGSVVYNYTNNRSGTATLKFLFISPRNTELQVFFEENIFPKMPKSFSILIKDTTGLNLAVLKNCMFKKIPDISLGTKGEAREWEFMFGDYEVV